MACQFISIYGIFVTSQTASFSREDFNSIIDMSSNCRILTSVEEWHSKDSDKLALCRYYSLINRYILMDLDSLFSFVGDKQSTFVTFSCFVTLYDGGFIVRFYLYNNKTMAMPRMYYVTFHMSHSGVYYMLYFSVFYF